MGKGSYVFLTVELFKHSSSFGNFDWFIENDDRNDDVKQMYETLFILTVHVPMTDIYSKFAIDVIEKSRKEFNTSFTTKDVNVILAGFHDSVIMYGLAVTETIEQGFDPMDGIEVTKRLWNRTFMNYLSGDIYINANGDKETDYTLEDFDPKSLRMRSVMYYSGRENKIVWLNLSKIHWPRNIIPSSDINVCYPDIVDLHCIQSSLYKVICLSKFLHFVAPFRLLRDSMADSRHFDRCSSIHCIHFDCFNLHLSVSLGSI